MKSYNILIVDDQVEWMNFHLDTLNKYFDDVDLNIAKAFGAREAFLKAISAPEPFDWVISDMEMEKVLDESYAGQWLLKNLKQREEFKNTKFLIVSGAPSLESIAFKLNVDFIPKYSYHHNQGLLKYKFVETFGISEI